MKRIFISAVIMAMVMGFSVQADAALMLRGTDTLVGNRLIYDEDLNITWYDYTTSSDTWGNQGGLVGGWADALSVTFGSTVYNDWRLPVTFDQSCSGYNCTNSEMGYLYYTELGNSAGGPLSTNFTDGLTGRTESFANLRAGYYWSGTESSANSDDAWAFFFPSGYQSALDKFNFTSALAVRPGDVSASVPEPSTLLLLGFGLAGMAVLRKRLGSREG